MDVLQVWNSLQVLVVLQSTAFIYALVDFIFNCKVCTLFWK